MASIPETVEAPVMVLDSKQLEAIETCCDPKNRVVVVTGAAGTGKTTILKTAYNAQRDAGYRVALAAPTGKAAKRIYEATGIDATTAHRLLEYTHPGEPDPKTGKPVQFSYPQRKRDNPLEIDVLYVDEYTMVNSDLHRSIFDALPNGACVRVFGDANQLAPIEEDKEMKGQPSAFVKMMQNDKIPTVRLETVHRQGKDSGILLNLQLVLKGRMPAKNDQWRMTFSDQPVMALQGIIFENMDDELIDWSSIDNQILTPQNTSWVGTQKLNAMIQQMFHNKMEPSAKIPRHDWSKYKSSEANDDEKWIRMFTGDKVIITRNMHDLGVFNGESGRIIEITADEEVIIDFGDREQAIPPLLTVMNRYGKVVEIDPRKDIDLGYAITTHKAQGSEYKNLLYVLNKSTAYMQNRRNLYTACSRGKETVHIISDQRSLSNSLYKAG